MQNDTRAEIARLDERIKTLNILLAEREKQLHTAFASAERATLKAEEAQSRVNATQNEFRGALKDAQGTFAPRTEMDRILERVQTLERTTINRAEHEVTTKRIQGLETTVSGTAGKSSGWSAAQTMTFQLLPLLASVLALFFIWKGKG